MMRISIAGSWVRAGIAGALALSLAGCGGSGLRSYNPFARDTDPATAQARAEARAARAADQDFVSKSAPGVEDGQRVETVWSLFGAGDDPKVTVGVNKYIWPASLEVLNFLPIESVDPFSGVIVTGYGTPPGGGTAYRATVYVQDPALDARSLKLALVTRSGPVSAETTRAVEDAILTRARQLRIRDAGL